MRRRAGMVPYYTYILGCENSSFYVGHTENLKNRFERHTLKTGAHHTASYTPRSVLYAEAFPTKQQAVQRERQLKRWSREKKRALIKGDLEKLRQLSQSHD